MPLTSKIQEQGIIWIPKTRSYAWKFLINSVDVTTDVWDIECTRVATEEAGSFRIKLDNNAHTYTSTFAHDQTVQIYADLSDGDTLVFQGYIEKIEKEYSDDSGDRLIITGLHETGRLLDTTVTESYTATSIESILEDLISTYASSKGFTYNKTTYPCTTLATIRWSNRPFWQCIIDLANLASYDATISNTKALLFYESGSVLNTSDAAIFRDTLYSTSGLGTDQADVRTKIIVYGEDDEGMPIVYTREDTGVTYAKERIIKDTAINTMEEAKERADAEYTNTYAASLKGEAKCMLLPSLNPAEKLWISYPTQEVHAPYKIYSYTHKFLTLETNIVVQREDTIPLLFKKRIKKELAVESITNANKLDYSHNFTFDDLSQVDQDLSSNISIRNGSIILTTGSDTGKIISISKTHPLDTNISQVEVMYKGQDMGVSTFYISVNGGFRWEEVSKDTLLKVVGTGKYLMLKVSVVRDTDNTNPSIDSLAILFS